MGLPQILVIVIYVLSLGVNLAKNGEQRNDKYSFGASLISTAIVMGLLAWGGFFK